MKRKLAILLCLAMMSSVNCYAASGNIVSGSVNVGVKEAISPTNPVTIKIYPKETVKQDSKIVITASNGRFDDNAWSKKGGADYYYNTNGKHSDDSYYYDKLIKEFKSKVSAGSDEKTAEAEVLKSVMGLRNCALPYKPTIISDTEMEVELFPIDGSYVDKTNSEITSNGKVYYEIVLPLIDIDEGNVSVTIDSNGTSVSDGTYKVATADVSYNKKNNANTETTVSELKPFNEYSDEFSIEISELKKGSFDSTKGNGKITLELNDGFSFKDYVVIEPGDNCRSAGKNFAPLMVYPKGNNKNIVEFNVPESFTGSSSKLCSIKVTGIKLRAAKANWGGDVVLNIYGDSVSFERLVLTSKNKSGTSTAVTEETTEVTSENVTESTTETVTEATTEAVTEVTTEAETEALTEKATYNVAQKGVSVTIGEKRVVVDGKSYDVDAAAYIQSKSQSTLVPLRFVALAFGGNIENADNSTGVEWDAETKTALIMTGGRAISFTAGSDVMYVNNKAMIMEHGVKAEITDGRMYIPFRALAQAIGADAEWDAETKTAVFK